MPRSKKNKVVVARSASAGSKRSASVPKTVQKVKAAIKQRQKQKPVTVQQMSTPNRPFQGALSTVGGAVGQYFGGPLGATLGSTAGDVIGRIFGFGAYTVRENSLLTGQTAAQAPMFSEGEYFTTITHREYVGDVIGTTDFNTTSYTLNPGNAKTFPWLSKVALNYESYRVKGMVVMYKTTSGVFSAASPALGAVMIATQYDVADPVFETKRDLDSYQFATSGAPCESFVHPIECAKGTGVLNNLYIRGSDNLTTDPRMYDMGRIVVATSGCPASLFVTGEIWVTYEVELYKPRISSNNDNPAIRWSYTDASPVNPMSSAISGYETFNNCSFLGNVLLANISTPGNCVLGFSTAGQYLMVIQQTASNGIFISAAGLSATPNPEVITTQVFSGFGGPNALLVAWINVKRSGTSVNNRLTFLSADTAENVSTTLNFCPYNTTAAKQQLGEAFFFVQNSGDSGFFSRPISQKENPPVVGTPLQPREVSMSELQRLGFVLKTN